MSSLIHSNKIHVNDVKELADYLIQQRGEYDKVFLQMIGSPAAGKSTLAMALMEEFERRRDKQSLSGGGSIQPYYGVSYLKEPAQQMIDEGDVLSLTRPRKTFASFMHYYLVSLQSHWSNFIICDSSIMLTPFYDATLRGRQIQLIIDTLSGVYNTKFVTIYVPYAERGDSSMYITEATTEFSTVPLYLSEPEKALLRLQPWRLDQYCKFIFPNRQVRVQEPSTVASLESRGLLEKTNYDLVWDGA